MNSEQLGAWTRGNAEVFVTDDIGKAIRLATSLERYIVPLSAMDTTGSFALDAINMLTPVKGRHQQGSPSSLYEHWKVCGKCGFCRSLEERATSFVSKWGLLGLWKLPWLGRRDYLALASQGRFGGSADVFRFEPLDEFLFACAVLGEFSRRLWVDADPNAIEPEGSSQGVAAAWDSGAEYLRAVYAARKGAPEHTAYGFRDEGELQGFQQWVLDITDPNRSQDSEFTERLLRRGTLEASDTSLPASFVLLNKAFERGLLKPFGTSRITWEWAAQQVRLAHGPEQMKQISYGDPQLAAKILANTEQNLFPGGEYGHPGLNVILADVQPYLAPSETGITLSYSFPTLWHAIHIQIGLWLARGIRGSLRHCSWCGVVFLRDPREDHGKYPKRFCSDRCRTAHNWHARRTAGDE